MITTLHSPDSNPMPATAMVSKGTKRPSHRLETLPLRSPWLIHLFAAYSRRYLKRHFNAVRLLGTQPNLETVTGPILLYANHPSWWDPLVGLFLAETLFPNRPLYAPIDAAALERYRFFARLGFFGVERGTRRGAVQFLRASEAVLADGSGMLWLTPQGRFSDVRERPLRFEPGIGHLASHHTGATFIPLGIEYTHWEEKLPEVLLHFGKPFQLTSTAAPPVTPEEASSMMEQRLVTCLDTLAEASRRRDPQPFTQLLAGRAGVGGVYDIWRRFRARLRNTAFDPHHGRL